MLTDDQLTTDLGNAFRDATTHLTYAGRVPSPRPSPLAAVPVLAAAAALVVVPTVAGQQDDGPVAAPTTSASPTAAPSQPRSTTPPLVTETVRLAGFRLTYTRPSSGGVGRLHAVAGVELPADAEVVPGGGPAARWTGADAETGDAALFVSPTGDPGDVFELTGAGWTTDQLVALQGSGEPTTVPLVTR